MKLLAYRLPEFQAKVETFNRKAKKWNLPLISIVETKRYTEEKKRLIGELPDVEMITVYLEYVDLDIIGDIPKFKGWSVHSRIEPTDIKGANFVYTAPNHEPVEGLRTTKMICQHCNMNRARSVVFLLENVETKEQKLVGKSCLKDFLPDSGIENIMSYMSNYPDVPGDDEETFGRIPREAFVYPVPMAIAESLVLINKWGYVSRKASEPENGKFATSDSIAITNKDREEIYSNDEIAAQFDSGAVEAVLKFILSKDSRGNDFFYNLQLAVQLDYCKPKMFGYIAAGVMMYRKTVEDSAAKADHSNEYIGTVGARIVFTDLKIVRRNVTEGNYGNTYIYGFEDSTGNSIVWFASKHIGDIGETVTLKGTIKAHNEYKGRNQTVLTRCTVI